MARKNKASMQKEVEKSDHVDKKAEAINLLISVKNLWMEIEGEAFYDLNGGRDFDKALDILEGLK